MATSILSSADVAAKHKTYDTPHLNDADFKYICTMAYKYCGLDIRPGKEGLVQSRLTKLMRQLDIHSFREYCNYLEEDSDGQALSSMVDCLTTNHTGFFREEQHFRFLTSTIVPAIHERQQIDIWSAACSTGEEPYSLAFALLEYFDGQGGGVPSIRILATDISNRALTIARRAVYSVEKFLNVPQGIVHKYMLKGSGNSQGLLRVKPLVRELIQFRRLNLMESFEDVGEFPLILCRNTMIYFDEPTQEKLIARFHQRLESGGYFFVGHSESLNRIKQPMKYICPATYRRSGELFSRTSGGRDEESIRRSK
jgi:chemotaxis protein methyltransferase CheR